MRAETFTQNEPDQRLAEVKVTTAHRWVRAVVVYGTPPGSHIGFWRTSYGNLRGWNLRLGKRYHKTLTMFVHTRPLREGER